ncbi:MAG: hydroxymethylbilane synthase [Sphingomonadaceae bacterium]
MQAPHHGGDARGAEFFSVIQNQYGERPDERDIQLKPDAEIRLGTRTSKLALAQTAIVSAGLAARGIAPERIIPVPLQTVGDQVQDRPLAEIGGKALWTRELDRALAEGEIDAAVHSMKDVESPISSHFVLAAVLPRADAADRLIGAASIDAIPSGALVGTSSPRRAAQLLHLRPDLRVVSIRGNVETRLRKTAAGEVAATFLAAAGLDRLGIVAGTRLAIDDFLPAASQGAIGVVARADDHELLEQLALLDHGPTRRAILAERAFLDRVGGNCHSAIAAHAIETAEGLRLTAEIYSADGRERVAGAATATSDDTPRDLAARLAVRLLADASAAIRASLGQF